LIDRSSSLEDICFAVAAALDKYAIKGVLTGGSAAALYAPEVNTSMDADFVLTEKPSRAILNQALGELGFLPSHNAGMFEHPDSEFTIDFPSGPLAVGGEYIRKTATLVRGDLCLRILIPVDCVRDRLAHFYHWNDYHALAAAVVVARAHCDSNDFLELQEWTRRESSPHKDFWTKYEEFQRRVQQPA
jgi:hypothetical protein